MPGLRVRFTVRRMMVPVAAVALLSLAGLRGTAASAFVDSGKPTAVLTDSQPLQRDRPTLPVREVPVYERAEFRGCKAISPKEIEELTGLKVGSRSDTTRTRLALGQIRRLYLERDYDLVEVTLLEGGDTGDTKLVIQIVEGPRTRIASIDFVGNQFFSDALLLTKIVSGKPIQQGRFGYQGCRVDEDRDRLIYYYQQQGFFEVQVKPMKRRGRSPGEFRLTYLIREGTRYSVRHIAFEGNTKIPSKQLRDGLELHSGKPFIEVLHDADKKKILAKYVAIGCKDIQLTTRSQMTDEPGIVDLVYEIEERNP
jgi:outer membrane protein insertion porin family